MNQPKLLSLFKLSSLCTAAFTFFLCFATSASTNTTPAILFIDPKICEGALSTPEDAFTASEIEAIVNRPLTIKEPLTLKKANIFAREAKEKETWAQNLSQAEIASVRLFTTFAYGELNRALQTGEVSSPGVKFIQLIIGALDKLRSTFRYVGTVTRSAPAVPLVELEKYIPGKEFVEPRFFSTGPLSLEQRKRYSEFPLDSEQAKLLCNIVFTIHSKNGVLISALSEHPAENEVLFASRSRFRTVRVSPLETSNPGRFFHIELEEMP